MPRYQTGFQCPETGLWVVARYAFGRVTMERAEHDDMDELVSIGESTEADAKRVREETDKYCKRHSGARCSSLEDADDYIRRVSDRQTDGFEVYDY